MGISEAGMRLEFQEMLMIIAEKARNSNPRLAEDQQDHHTQTPTPYHAHAKMCLFPLTLIPGKHQEPCQGRLNN